MTKLKATIRLNKENEYEIFYYEDNNDIGCYTMSEGHGTCDHDYYLSCKYIPDYKSIVQAKALVIYYTKQCEILSNIKLVIVKRLRRN